MAVQLGNFTEQVLCTMRGEEKRVTKILLTLYVPLQVTPDLPKHPEVCGVTYGEGDGPGQRGDQVRHRHVEDEIVDGGAEEEAVLGQYDDDGQVSQHGHQRDERGVGPAQGQLPCLGVRDVDAVREVVVIEAQNTS